MAVNGAGNDKVLCEISETPLSSIDLGLGRLGREVAREKKITGSKPNSREAPR